MTEPMRAVEYDFYGTPARVREVPRPECPPDGAVIRVEATGVCRSDWHAWRGHDPVELPHIPGHEFAGVVSEVGPQVREFAVGDRVTAPFVNGCGACEWCRSGQTQVCPAQTQPGFTHAGSFAEFVVVRVADLNLVRLPEGMDAVTAASLGCRFATAFAAVRRAGVEPGTEVAIFGCGGVGLSAIMIASALGGRVTAVDVSESALARAAELGATTTVRSGAEVIDEVIAVTGGGAQVTIDAIGSAATADAAVRSLRRQGRHAQVGLMLEAAASAPLPWDRVIAWELQILGSHGMAATEYPAMLELIAEGVLDPSRLVGRVTDLAGAADALMAMDAPAPAGAGIVVAQP